MFPGMDDVPPITESSVPSKAMLRIRSGTSAAMAESGSWPSVISNPFFGDAEADMVNHMNEDHANALPLYCLQAQIHVPESTVLSMVGIDSEGFHLRVNDKVVYIAFPQVLSSPLQVREALVAMLKIARAGVKNP